MARLTTISPETLAYLGRAQYVPTLAVLAVEAAAHVSLWATRRQTRRALKDLSDWQLKDVGLTPLEAHREASKAFWQG